MTLLSHRSRDISERLFVWLAIISTAAAGVVYLYFLR